MSVAVDMLKDPTIRVVVVGAGHMANKVHYPALASFADVEIAAICDRKADKLRDTAAKYQIRQTYLDYRKMIEAVVPDAVFAIGHPHTMYDVWMWCLEQGLNLFIEKPLGLTLHQARVLAHVAESNHCITQVCFQRRASPLLQKLAGECKARGPLRYGSVEFFKNSPEPFLGARDHMFDDGVHAIDTLRNICEGEVIGIHSVTKRIGVPDINFIAALIEFDSGASGHIHCNWTSGYRSFRVGIHGPSICAEADLEGRGCLYKDGDVNGTAFDARQLAGSNEIFVFGGFQAKIREFLNCLRSGKQPSSNFSDALKTHIIAEKILAKDLLGQ
jgi:virulence factor